jgi:(S)-ureidoglycine aminohydrolase
MHHLGSTRSALHANHLLQTPDTFVRIKLPGMERAMAIVHASPALGARFSQYTAEFEAGGVLGPTSWQRFVYVLEGALQVEFDGQPHPLAANDFAYVPKGMAHAVSATGAARAVIIEKLYLPEPGTAAPNALVGSEAKVASKPLMGDDALQVKALLPDEVAFDFAVNTMEYQPGAALSMVEVHVMEHGLLMLEGGGIYRLGDAWYPVAAGDAIWMAPYCPQWFGALGKVPAKYLIYKDWNRSPER